MEKALSYSGIIVGPRNTAISSGFYSLIRAIRRSNSKGEEERIVQKELELIRQNLSQPDVSLKKLKEFMVRLIYCEMLGQSASFAYIHAIKMAQQGVLLNKRVGYLGVNLFLDSEHELILLLINTIQKDLNSTNVLDVCGGLTACSNLIGPEMIPLILPLIAKNLQHPQEIVRRKAVLVHHSFLLTCPQLIRHMTEYFQQALCDRSPGVMTGALHIYQALIKEHPEDHKSLVRPLTSILKQVVQRKLSLEFEFRGIPAPWLQIQIMKMLARLGLNDPKTSLMMYDVLEEVLDSSNTLSLISCGVQYECIMTIANIHPKPSLLKKASICITRFLRSQSNNLKYLGVKALGVIHKVYPESCRDHQMTVVECLEDEDPTIKRATLNLLYEMCKADNIIVILDKVLDHLNSSSMEHHSEHIHKMVSLAHQFQPSIRWYVTIIVKIICSHSCPPNTINNLITSIKEHEPEEARFISYLVEEMLTAAKQTHITDDLMILIAWVLGEFSHSEKSTVPASEVLSGLCALLSKPMSSTTTSYVLAAIRKSVSKHGLVSEDVTEITVNLQASENVQLKQVSSELEALCSDPELMSALQSRRINQFDWTLSFLDEYVSDALGNGAAPYKPKQQRSAEKHNSPEVMRPFLAGLNFKPYVLHSASHLSTTESLSSVNIQDGASWSPSQSLGSDATGNSIDMELATRPATLKTEGIQKVWSQAGYSRAKEANRKTLSPENTRPAQGRGEDCKIVSKQPLMHITPVRPVGMSTPLIAESEEERRKQELAMALFGTVTKQTEENEIPQSHVQFSSEREDLKSSEAFADFCTEEGLIMRGERSHDVLLNIGDVSVKDGDRITTQHHLLECTNKQSDSVKDGDGITTQHHLLTLECTNKQSDSNQTTLLPVGSDCLLDDTMPPLPVELDIYPRSPATEELVFDTNVRLMMKRVWQKDALVLVFYVTAFGTIEGATITLDVPSNMKCFINDQETNMLDVTSSGIALARLICHVPAANTSLGGELTFKDATKTLKRLFFYATIHIQDLLRAKEITTEEFGKLWTELSLDQRQVLEVKGYNLSSIMNMMASIHMYPVEIIGEEGILAASLLQSSTCLIHIKLDNNKLDIWVKSRSKLLSQILANKCVSLVKNELVTTL